MPCFSATSFISPACPSVIGGFPVRHCIKLTRGSLCSVRPTTAGRLGTEGDDRYDDAVRMWHLSLLAAFSLPSPPAAPALAALAFAAEAPSSVVKGAAEMDLEFYARGIQLGTGFENIPIFADRISGAPGAASDAAAVGIAPSVSAPSAAKLRQSVHAHAMRECSVHRTVIASVASGVYVDSLLRLALSARHHSGFGCVVTQAYDIEHIEQFHHQQQALAKAAPAGNSTMGLLHILPPPDPPLLPEAEFCGHQNSLYGWRRTHLHKMLMLRRVLEAGLSLLSLDANYLLEADLMPFVRSLNSHTSVDVVGVHDGKEAASLFALSPTHVLELAPPHSRSLAPAPILTVTLPLIKLTACTGQQDAEHRADVDASNPQDGGARAESREPDARWLGPIHLYRRA